MHPIASCPRCARSLGRFESDGGFRATCTACRLSLEGFWGRLSHWHSAGEPLFYLSPSLPKLFRRRYEFRITTPGRDLKQLTFTTPGLADQVPVQAGNRVSVLYTSREGRMERLMAIHNHSLGKSFRPAQTIPSVGSVWRTRGGVSAALGVGALFGGVDLGLIAAGAIAFSLSTRFTHVAHLSVPELRRDRPDEARLLAELRLVQQRGELGDRITQLRQENQEHKELIKRLQALRGKMLTYNPTLYAPRVSRLETAVRLLQQRIDHNRHLVQEYHQTIEMLDIELEAASLVDRLPDADGFTHHLLQRVEELRAIESQNQATLAQIQAIPEVQRLQLDA